MKSFYTLAVSTAMLVTSALAIEPLQFLNVVRTEKTCREDFECKTEDLAWIEGRGRPNNDGETCCATFPRETWNEMQQSYIKM